MTRSIDSRFDDPEALATDTEIDINAHLPPVDTWRPCQRARQHLGAFDQAMTDAVPGLRKFALYLSGGNSARADDLLMDTLAAAVQSRDNFEPGTKIGAWLEAIMKRQRVANFKRNTFVRRDPITNEPEICPFTRRPIRVQKHKFMEDPSQAIDVIGEELIATDDPSCALEASQTYEALPPIAANALIYAATLASLEKVAEMLGVTINAVKVRLHRARQQLITEGI